MTYEYHTHSHVRCITQGCTVNKTVTEKMDGEYLIKYRGCHLKDCGQVERIRDL